MHTRLMRERSDIRAIVHTHSPYCLAFAIAHKAIPTSCNEGFGVRAEQVLCAPFAAPGTEDIGLRALETLNAQPASMAVLLANHGLLTIGNSLDQAYRIASNTEFEAQVCLLASVLGTPVPLPSDLVARVIERARKRDQMVL